MSNTTLIGRTGRILLLLVVGALCAAPMAMATTPGALVQLPGAAGCITAGSDPVPVPAFGAASDSCATGTGFSSDLADIAASPDGKNVYVANGDVDDSGDDAAVLVFSRGAGGQLSQLAGDKACISEGGVSGSDPETGDPLHECTVARALESATDLVVSPDGENVYVTTGDRDGIVVLDRAADGSLTQRSGSGACVTRTGLDAADDECGSAHGLRGAKALAISPDGDYLYVVVTDASVNGLLIFHRNDDGSLTQLEGTDGCVTHGGVDGESLLRGTSTDEVSMPCEDARPMWEPSDVAVSHDGRNVYVSVSEGRPSYDSEDDHGPGAIAVFDRDTTDGTLSQPDGPERCLTRAAGYAEDETGGPCTEASGLEDAAQIEISPDDKNVYVAAQGGSPTSVYPGALTVFRRDGAGHLTPLDGQDACVTADGSDGTSHYESTDETPQDPAPCAEGNAMTEPSGIGISADGKNVYSMNEDDDAIAAFARDAGTGAVQQLAGRDGCVQQQQLLVDARARSSRGGSGTCTEGRATQEASKMVIVGCSAYVVSRESWAVDVFSRCNPEVAATPPACLNAAGLAFSVAEGSGGTQPKKLHFRIDGGDVQTRETVGGDPGTVTLDLPGDGRHTVEMWGEDELGRTASDAEHRTVAVLVDRTAPTAAIAGDQGTAEYVRGQPATVTITAADAGSGLATDPSATRQAIPTNVVGEHIVQRTAEDHCGNAVTATFHYRVVESATVRPQSVPKACISRRVIPIHLARGQLRGATISSASAKLVPNGKSIKVTRRSGRYQMVADLKGFPKGTFSVTIKVKLSDGRTVTGKRTYRTCTPKQKGGRPKL